MERRKNDYYNNKRELLKKGLSELGLEFTDDYKASKNYLNYAKNYLPLTTAGMEKYNATLNFLKSVGLEENKNFFTPSGNVCGFREGFGVHRRKVGWEIVLKDLNICSRIIFDATGEKKAKRDEIGGKNAAMQLGKEFKRDGIDLKKYAVTNGAEVKKEIPSPLICTTLALKLHQTYEHVHHLDFHSAYASGICATYPELKVTYERLYAKRKENKTQKKRIKSLFTNSTGFYQSEFCIYGGQGNGFSLAPLAKAAMTWTKKSVMEMSKRLVKAGYSPLLYNTDGIWYAKLNEEGESIESKPYEDELCGETLGTYDTDHIDCKFRVKSKGAYEFIENGQYRAIVRGVPKVLTENWQWGGMYSPEAKIRTFKELDDGTLKEIVNETITI